MRWVVAFIFFAATACASGGIAEDAEGDPLASAVDAWANDNDISAVSVALVSPDGDVTTLGGSRDGEPPDVNSLYEVGSLTKTMVAATALLLVESGILDLDVPIQRWLPEFPRGDAVTLRHLLSHTSGISDGSAEDADLGELAQFLEPVEPPELVETAAGFVGAGEVPAEHRYANSGYWVVGGVIEAATGQDLAAVMREHLLDPLELADTFLAWSESVPRDLEPGELAGPTGEALALGSEVVPGVVSRAWAAGGVVSTASDMATFYDALFDGLVTASSREDLTTPPGGSTYGLGVERRRWAGGVAGWGHNGAIPGYSVSAAVGNNGWTVVVLTNRFAVTSAGVSPDGEAFIGSLLTIVDAP